ncbi:phage terminase large subunit [Gemmata sp.]|uniref:phage terminase large subunit n=1 Tax=Gemmata sp. TaxID=1914242 RepID=UPI003F6F49B4
MAPERRFELCGGSLAAFRDAASREVLLAGPAGTGKTLANLAKVLWFGDRFPGARMLIVRKTRHSLTETALVTWERDLLGDGHPIIAKPIDRGHRHAYRFANKSVLVTGGMDKPDKVLSSEWDLIYVPEATDLSLVDWETLGGRLRANAGPFDQLLGDCNPTSPHHWLYKRCQAGRCRLVPTTHCENPRYFDHRARAWTDAGRRYVHGRLRQMTGTRRKRFLEGKWVSAEGAVYAFDQAAHGLPAGWRPSPEWPRVWAIDWGDRSPTVLQLWAVDGEGRMSHYREVFQTHMRADELGRWARAEIDAGREPVPHGAVCDHDEDKRREFERASGVPLEMADKADRDRGIQTTQARFDREPRPDGAPGRPRIFFAEGCRETLRGPGADPLLVDEGRPASTLEELAGYVWDPKFLKDEPVAANDHGMDALRYAARWVDAHYSAGAADAYTPYGGGTAWDGLSSLGR